MDRRRLMLWSVLAVAVLITLYSSPLTKGLFGSRASVPARPPVARPGGAPGAPPPSAAPPVPTLTEKELAAWRNAHAAPLKRDPFFTAEEERALAQPPPAVAPRRAVSAAAPEPAMPRYTVQLVMISATTRVAAIDGRLVTEGEMVGQERVDAIHPDGVILERGGRRRRIEVAATAGPSIQSERPAAERRPR